MAVNDDTLRTLAGERQRLEDHNRGGLIHVPAGVLRDAAMLSELAAELLRRRATERADKERVRRAVLEACLRCAAGLLDGDTADAIAGRVTDQLAEVPAVDGSDTPAQDAPLLSENDREMLARFARESPHPVESAAIRQMLTGHELDDAGRDILMLFVSSPSHYSKWPRTCAAIARALEGAS